MKLIYLKSALKCNSFDVAIGTKIPFFRLLVTIEPGRSLLQFVTTNCLIPSKCATSYKQWQSQSQFVVVVTTISRIHSRRRSNSGPESFSFIPLSVYKILHVCILDILNADSAFFWFSSTYPSNSPKFCLNTLNLFRHTLNRALLPFQMKNPSC